MTVPAPRADAPLSDGSSSSLVRAAIWVAIGALIAAAIVCVVWVMVGTQNGIIGRAFLTILLLAAFAGVAIIDAHLASRRPAWFALASMLTWVVSLLIGAFLVFPAIWTIYIGVTNYRLTGVEAVSPSMVGLSNYTKALNDALFHNALWLTMLFVLGSAIIGRRIGDTVSYRAPNGKPIEVKILEVQPYQS